VGALLQVPGVRAELDPVLGLADDDNRRERAWPIRSGWQF